MPGFPTDLGNVIYPSPPAHASEEDIAALKKLDAELRAIGATMTIIHDEFLIDAPKGKVEEANAAVTEYFFHRLRKSAKAMGSGPVGYAANPEFTWEDAVKGFKP